MNLLLGEYGLLSDQSRLSLLRPEAESRSLALDLLVLIECGVAAALLVSLVPLPFRLPGHAILQAVPPIALGMAFAPRRGAGVLMSLSAAITFMFLSQLGITKGPGAHVATAAIGALLDVGCLLAARPWQLYAAFGAAGMLANLAAFATQLIGKLTGWSVGGNQPLAAWWPTAAFLFPLFGLAAGLVSAAILISWKSRDESQPKSEERLT